MNSVDVCAIGHITKESEVFGGVYRLFIGGPPYFLSIALKRLGSSVYVITRVAESDRDILSELYVLGIGVTVLPTTKSHSFHTVYGGSFDERILHVLSVAEPFKVSDVDCCPDAKYIYIGPLTTSDFNLEFMKRANERAPVVLDVQGFTRMVIGNRIEYVDWQWKRDGLKYTSIFKADIREAEILTKTRDPLKASEILASWGPAEILITSNSGLHLRVGNDTLFAPFIVDEVRGRVGRGDTCLASYLHARLKGMGYEDAVKFAAAATSLKLRYQGPLREGEVEVVNFLRTAFREVDPRNLVRGVPY